LAETSLDPQQSHGWGRADWRHQAARLPVLGSAGSSSEDWIAASLPSGLRLILIPRPHTPTVVVRAFVRAGSRYDVEHLPPGRATPPLGLAHLTEHLLFKGTRRHSQRQLFAAVERVGGALEAGTAKEYLVLSAIVPPEGLAIALEILAEILSEPTLSEEDFWNEKLVVLEEMRRAQDREERIFDLLAETLWRVHPLRHPVLGNLSTLQALDHTALLSFYRQRFAVGNAVLVVCGAFEPVEAERCAAEHSSALPVGQEQRPHPVDEPTLDGAHCAYLERDLHQATLLLAAPTVSMGHQDRSALKIIERMLGMGGSARLYQRLREQERLVYSVQTVVAHYEDAGYLAVRCACDPQRLQQVQQAILEEWDRLCQAGATEDELRSAQANYVGTLARSFETNLAVAGIYGVEALLHRVEPFADAVRRIRAVEREDVLQAARAYLNGKRYVAATIGPATKSAKRNT
jgi:predicted Zn-dependent peptidase